MTWTGRLILSGLGLLFVAWLVSAGLLGYYMVFVYVVIAATVVEILFDWCRKGRPRPYPEVEQGLQYVFTFVENLVLSSILFSIMVGIWRLAHGHS